MRGAGPQARRGLKVTDPQVRQTEIEMGAVVEVEVAVVVEGQEAAEG